MITALIPKKPRPSRRKKPEINRVVAIDRLAKAPKTATRIGKKSKARANLGSHSKFR